MRSHVSVVGATLLALAFASLPACGPAPRRPPEHRIDAIFTEYDRDDSPGCAVGVIRDGAFVFRKGYGMASLELGVPNATKTVFYVGSVSKQLVAASVALAARQGHLSLGDDIREHLPEMPDYGATITVRHLIHHTSGLRDYLALMRMAGMRYEDVHTDEELVALLARQRALNFPPGEEHLYSNSGYLLLAEIVERATVVHNRVFAHPQDGRDFEALVRYMMRSPVSLTRLRFTPGAEQVVYTRKGGHDTAEPEEDERIDADEFVARVLVQIPDPRRHLVRYYGACSNRARGQRRKAEEKLEANDSSQPSEPVPPPPERAALRRRWANLIRRVYEVDPLLCLRGGAEMRVIGFITEPRVIKRILEHIRKPRRASRPPPCIGPPLVRQPAVSPA